MEVTPVPPPHGEVTKYSAKQKKRGCCFRLICCCYCFLFILIVIAAVLLFCFYTFYSPRVPFYEVHGLEVKAFDAQRDFSLTTEILINIKAYNPNKALGFIYGDDNHVHVIYNGSELCSGKLPAFTHGTKNTTMLQVMLSGRSVFGFGLQEEMMDDKHKGRIPLLVKVEEPVRIVVFDIPLRQFLVFINCSLIVDNLAPKKKANILSTKYDFSYKI